MSYSIQYQPDYEYNNKNKIENKDTVSLATRNFEWTIENALKNKQYSKVNTVH